MADPIYITVEDNVIEIIEIGFQGPAGNQGETGEEGPAQDITGKLDHTGGTITGADEAVSLIDVTDGQNITVDFNVNGLALNIDETVSSFTLTKGTWSDLTLASMLIYIKEIGSGGSSPAITWAAGWGFPSLHTPPVADGRTADTGFTQMELYRIMGDQFCKLVEET